MNKDAKFIIVNKGWKNLFNQIFGTLLIGVGIVILGILLIYRKEVADDNIGGKISFGFFLIMLGMPFIFPNMLKGGEYYSSMRLIVFMIISVFVIVTIKLGWSVKDLEHFSIDSSWKYIIGLALGGKTAQSFAENLGKSRGKPLPDDNSLDPFKAKDEPKTDVGQN